MGEEMELKKLCVMLSGLLLISFLLVGCTSSKAEDNPRYICWDGSQVADYHDCPSKPSNSETESKVPEPEDVQPESDSQETREASEPVLIEEEVSASEVVEELPKEDKCSDVETKSLRDLCYEQKYFEIAVEANDVSICDEIVSPDQLGGCYAQVAFAQKDAEICGEAEEISYEATGYYDEITSREICFYHYSLWMETNYLIFQPEYCSEIENLQLKKECEGLDDKYYEYPESMEFAGGRKEGDILSIQLKFERDSPYFSYGENALQFQETSLNGELTYRLERRLEGGTISQLSDKAACNQCKEEFSSLLKSGKVKISREDFGQYEISGGAIQLLYMFDISLEGLQIEEEMTCYGVQGDDQFQCNAQCSALRLSGQLSDSEVEDCYEDCEDEKEDIDCPMEYYLEIRVKGEDGAEYEKNTIVPQLLE